MTTTFCLGKRVGGRRQLDLTLIRGKQRSRRLVGCLASSLSEFRLATNPQLRPPQPLLFTRTSQPPARSIEPSLGGRRRTRKRGQGLDRGRYWRLSRHPAVPLAAIPILPREKQAHETQLRVTRQLGGSLCGPEEAEETRLGSCCTGVESLLLENRSGSGREDADAMDTWYVRG